MRQRFWRCMAQCGVVWRHLEGTSGVGVLWRKLAYIGVANVPNAKTTPTYAELRQHTPKLRQHTPKLRRNAENYPFTPKQVSQWKYLAESLEKLAAGFIDEKAINAAIKDNMNALTKEAQALAFQNTR